MKWTNSDTKKLLAYARFVEEDYYADHVICWLTFQSHLAELRYSLYPD